MKHRTVAIILIALIPGAALVLGILLSFLPVELAFPTTLGVFLIAWALALALIFYTKPKELDHD